MRRRGQAAPCIRLRGWLRPPIGEFTIPKRSACCFSGGFRRDVLFVRPGGSDKPGAVVERQYRRFAVMATDLRPGAVIFCSPSAETNMDTGGGVQWQTFTVDENDAVVPLDMPANLATLSANAWWLYNPNNKTLSIGTADGIYLFAADREGKLFTPIKTAAELAENNPDYGIYKPVFADDLSLLSVVSHTNPSSAAGGYRGDAYGYVLANGDGRLYAQRTVDLAGESFVTGFATGNTAGGRVEFNGALPELSLKVNVTPAPDTFEFTGEAE